MSSKRDYYEVLSVERTATAVEIKKSYRKLAMKFHPDRNPDDAAAEKAFKECAEAYSVLSDDEKRATYDRFGHAGLAGPGGGPGFASVDDVFGGLGDLFGEFFGFGGGGRRGRRRSGPRRGADIHLSLRMSFEEAAFGGSHDLDLEAEADCDRCMGDGIEPGHKAESCATCGGVGQVVQQQAFLRIQVTCPSCRGVGQVVTNPCDECSGRGRTLKEATETIKVPAGVDTGVALRVQGKGHHGTRGGPRGDLFVEIEVEQHELFERRGKDVMMVLEVSIPRAVLGGKAVVPTLEDDVEIDIPVGCEHGRELRIRGAGVQGLRGGGRGDQLVYVAVRVPKKLSGDERELYEKLADIGGEEVSHRRGLRALFERFGNH